MLDDIPIDPLASLQNCTLDEVISILQNNACDTILNSNQAGFDSFFLRKCGRGSPYIDFGFLKIRNQIRVGGDLNLGGWVVHPLP
jgi:hypothetical protein